MLSSILDDDVTAEVRDEEPRRSIFFYEPQGPGFQSADLAYGRLLPRTAGQGARNVLDLRIIP